MCCRHRPHPHNLLRRPVFSRFHSSSMGISASPSQWHLLALALLHDDRVLPASHVDIHTFSLTHMLDMRHFPHMHVFVESDQQTATPISTYPFLLGRLANNYASANTLFHAPSPCEFTVSHWLLARLHAGLVCRLDFLSCSAYFCFSCVCYFSSCFSYPVHRRG